MTTDRSTTQRFIASEYFVLGLCGLVFLIFAPFSSVFASPKNVWNILVSFLPLLLLATGQTLVLITGGIDLSVGAVVGFSSVAGALVVSSQHGLLAGYPLAAPAGVAVMVASGLAVGGLNGACIAWLRMPAFMVTLTTAMFFQGLAIWLAKKAANAESVISFLTVFLPWARKHGSPQASPWPPWCWPISFWGERFSGAGFTASARIPELPSSPAFRSAPSPSARTF